MELELILERLRLVTEQKSNRAMCIYLGFNGSASGSWIRTGGVPYKACLIAAQKTGYTMEWIVTGKGPQKHGDAPPPEIDEVKMQNDFLETVNSAIEMGILNPTKDATPEALIMLARMMYRKTTGSQTIPEITDSTLSA
tara:strand:+ start:1520 stop:1936 length:417 start_codon:yes stop_codon:yes gene_type:complete